MNIWLLWWISLKKLSTKEFVYMHISVAYFICCLYYEIDSAVMHVYIYFYVYNIMHIVYVHGFTSCIHSVITIFTNNPFFIGSCCCVYKTSYLSGPGKLSDGRLLFYQDTAYSFYLVCISWAMEKSTCLTDKVEALSYLYITAHKV